MSRFTEIVFGTGLPKRDHNNEKRVNLWAFAWAGTLLLAMATMTTFNAGLLALIALLALHLYCALRAINAYRYFLRELDEMERKVQLDAIAFSFAMTIVIFSTGSILAVADIVPELNAAVVVLSLSLCYVAGLIIGRLRLS